jgi:type IV pilus assembly protein PilA
VSQPPPPQYPQHPPYAQYPQYAAPPKKSMTCWVVGLIILACSVPVLGVVSALAIYGIRRYLAASKTGEAKANVVAIASSAQSAYERRRAELSGSGSQLLCASATAVPSEVPSGRKYVSASSDWESGDDASGWKCLKFSIGTPQYYQYRYAQGGGYRASAVDPGPDGFEAAAAGDLDADGINSLFVRTGRVESGSLAQTNQIYIEGEFE